MTTGIKTRISDDQITELNKKVGVLVRPDLADWQLADARVTRSSIRTWAVLNADMRPLYMDPEHAAGSPWKTIIAPPALIVSQEQIDPETEVLAGSFSVLNSAEIDFNRPISMGDTIVSESEIRSVEEITESADSGRVVSVVIESRVETQDQQPVGKVVLDWHLFERGSAAQRALFGDREDAHMHSQEDIEALGAEYKLETQRGADTLYWEDVTEGDELQALLKGPTTRARHNSTGRKHLVLGAQTSL